MLKIYGIPNSQPVRAVVWACLQHDLPFDFVLTSQNKDAKTPAFLANVNPRGTVPAIDDDGVVLWESHAILIYLCEKHGWQNLWPSDLVARARINQYLHFHHRNTRELVVPWSQTLWASVFDVQSPSPGWLSRNTFPGFTNNKQVCRETLAVIEQMLNDNRWIARTEQASIADLSAYEELGQNQPQYANCTDYTDYPNIRRWLTAMGQLPMHDTVHSVWRHIGDINKVEGGMRTIVRANKQTAQEWAEAVNRMSGSSDKNHNAT